MRRLAKVLAWTVAILLLTLSVAWWAARPPVPDGFYTALASRLPSRPGVLLRQERFERKVPAGAIAWRILYTTTRADGVEAVASAIVAAPKAGADVQRPVIAWTHGTTGVVPGCAPSLLSDPFANVPALVPLVERGWIYVATDYVGQGTQGPHPYLIGEGEARSALDAVRAARHIKDIRTSDRTVIWGHSQGGHAALWTAMLASSYAPDITILGVAAIAPATDLSALVEANQHTPVGRIMSSFVLQAYSESYADVDFGAYTSAVARVLARDMAGRCLADRKALFSVLEAIALRGSIFGVPPGGGALGRRLLENSPVRPIMQPLFIAQGLADDLVLPSVQARFVNQRCGAGQELEFRRYSGRDHLSILAADSPLVPDLLAWTQDRLTGIPVRGGCSNLPN